MKVQQTLTALLIISLSQCIPILKNEKDDSQAWLALLPLVQPSGSTGSQTCNPGVVPDFCTAAQADYGCSVYEGMDARLDGGFTENTNAHTFEFSALCRGYKYDGVYAGAYTVSGDNVTVGSEIYVIYPSGNIVRNDGARAFGKD